MNNHENTHPSSAPLFGNGSQQARWKPRKAISLFKPQSKSLKMIFLAPQNILKLLNHHMRLINIVFTYFFMDF